MPLNLPVQRPIDPREGYPVYLPVVNPIPEEDAVLLDEAGGSYYGSLPGDPSTLRCARRAPGCEMPPVAPVPAPFAMPGPVALAGLLGI